MCFYHNDYLTSIKIKGSSRIYVYISLYFSMQRQIQPLARLRKDCVHYYARDKTLIKWQGDDINVAQPNKKRYFGQTSRYSIVNNIYSHLSPSCTLNYLEYKETNPLFRCELTQMLHCRQPCCKPTNCHCNEYKNN